jgi:hypothetical protein
MDYHMFQNQYQEEQEYYNDRESELPAQNQAQDLPTQYP